MSGSEQRAYRLVCAPRCCPGVDALLQAEGFRSQPLPFSGLARELLSGPTSLGSSLAATFGWIYIQDRSSMLPPLCLDPDPGAAVLDLCASPGGKTGFLAQLVGPGGLVLANEPNPKRLATLRQNLKRMNLPAVVSCSYKGEAIPLPSASWPYILVDAPCSGWGTAERHPKVTRLWQGDKVEPLITLQRQLLARAADLLTPGGRLVYSTCTTNVQENEQQLLWAEKTLGLEILPLSPQPGFDYDAPHLGVQGCLRVRGGGGTGAQGFFVAGLTRPASRAQGQTGLTGWESLPGRELGPKQLGTAPGAVWGNLPPGRVLAFGDRVVFVPEATRSQLPQGFTWQGSPLGRLRRGVIRLDPAARLLLPEAGPAQGLILEDTGDVRALLSGRSLALDARRDWAGLYWRDLPLGWLTVKGRRVVWSGR